MIDFNDNILNASDGMFSRDNRWRDDKPTILIFMSCHGRTLIEYFSYARPDICDKYNILRLETGPMTLAIQKGIDVFGHPTIREIFGRADIVVTYHMGPRMQHHDINKVSKLFKPGAKVITMVAPNFSAFHIFGYDGYGSHIGLLHLFDSGCSKEEAWRKIVHRDFDPFFKMRWRIEMGRLIDKETHHDIGLSRFIKEHHRKVKLWMGPAHPSYIVMAYAGNEIGRLLGYAAFPEEHIIGLDYSRAAVGGSPETDYEFKYYGFEYPQRHKDDYGGMDYYRPIFDAIHHHWLNSGNIPPQTD